MNAESSSKVTIHMVSSLDGFIARPDNDISWMKSTDFYEAGKTLTDEDITEYLKRIECYVMGAQTYEHALNLGWPYGDYPVFVCTNRKLPVDRSTVTFFQGDLSDLINKQLTPNYKNIWMVGGAIMTKEFMRLKLADEIIVTIMPILLGDGTLFFDYIGLEQKLHLTDVTAYKDGMVELSYDILKK